MSNQGIVTQEISSKEMMESHESAQSSSYVTMKSSSQTSSYKSSSNKMISSNGISGASMSLEDEMKRMQAELEGKMGTMKMDALSLLPHGKTVVPEDLIKLSHQDIQHFANENSQDKLKYNFDVTQSQNESVVVKSDGSKVEIHAKKQVKCGNDETSEEYSKVYEVPKGVDPKIVTSSLHTAAKPLTVEIPISK